MAKQKKEEPNELLEYNRRIADEWKEDATEAKSPLVFSLAICEDEKEDFGYISFTAQWIDKETLIGFLTEALEAIKKEHYIQQIVTNN